MHQVTGKPKWLAKIHSLLESGPVAPASRVSGNQPGKYVDEVASLGQLHGFLTQLRFNDAVSVYKESNDINIHEK
jgi:hypothetical protein